MSKNKGGGKFNNEAARRFNEINRVDTMSQEDIFRILEKDMKTMLDQQTAYRQHKPGATPPNYIANAFANVSTSLFFEKFIEEHTKIKIVKKKVKVKGKKHKKKVKVVKFKSDFDDDELESLRQIVADAYKKSVTNFYANQVQEYADRNHLLSKAFIRLCPELYLATEKLEGLKKSQRRDLTIQVYGDPVSNFKFVHKTINMATNDEKDKIKILKELYGKRFVRAVGAALTVENNQSDCLGLLFSFVASKKLRKRAKYVRAYAEAYKRNKSHYFQVNAQFYEDNKEIFKDLKKIDRGYKKSFKTLKNKSAKDKQKEKIKLSAMGKK